MAEKGGHLGVVVPRSVLAAKGSEEFRWTIFEKTKTIDATTLTNTARWLFDMEPRYTVALLTLQRAIRGESEIRLRGPYSNYQDFVLGSKSKPARFKASDALAWNDSASVPLISTAESGEVFAQLRKAPRLDLDLPGQWRARPHTELHATNDKKDKKTGQILMDLASEDCPEGFWPIYKGESFDLWSPDSGTYYAWGDPELILPRLQLKRTQGKRLKKSVFFECDADWCNDPDTLPCQHPRIAFRDITNRTNRRTVICTLIPPEVFITNKGPYLIFSRGSTEDEAYVLGIMSSIPFDWYARRFVEINLNFYVLNPFPVPRPDTGSPLRKRVIELSGRLACPDDRYLDWAKNIGVDCGPLEDSEKQDMIEELDAVVAHLYGLSESQLAHVFETFHVGWDYQDQLDATLKHFITWAPKT